MVPSRRSLKARCKAGLKQALQFILPGRWIIWRGRKDGQAIALTFDDGPHPEWTPKVLDTLLAFKAKATFFLVGEKTRKYPEIVHRIAGEGHEIGNHTHSHRVLSGLSTAQIHEEIELGAQAIQECIGTSPNLVRTPKGVQSLRSFWYLLTHHLTAVAWSVDPEDFMAESAETILAKVERQLVGSGDIILLHDKNRHTIDALPRLLAMIQNRGLETVALSHYLVPRGKSPGKGCRRGML